MRSGFTSQHWNDEAGKPAGGIAQGTGFVISWQHGPLGLCNCGRPAEGQPFGEVEAADHAGYCNRIVNRNGAFLEDVIAAAADRLRYHQAGEFASEENAAAIAHLELALGALNARTVQREARGVEGTHIV